MFSVIIAEVTVDIGGTETPLYFSTTGYISNPGDTPASTNYPPIITGTIETSEQLSITSNPSFSFTDIEIANPSGIYDSWLTYVWVNRSIKILGGNTNAARSTFTLIFDGIIADIGSSNRNVLNIKVRDKMQRLNAPVLEWPLGGTSVNKDALLPMVFGEVFNITPLLTNDATHEYMVSNSPIERIIEVRDLGVPVGYTQDLLTGKIYLLARPSGTITCSVQGYKPSDYDHNVARNITNICSYFGKTVDRFQSADIDWPNFWGYMGTYLQAIGYYVSSKENIITVIQALANSLGSQVFCNRLGLLQIFQIAIAGSSTITIDEKSMIANSFKITNRPEVIGAINFNYCKNWTVQDKLETGIVTTSKTLMAKEWVTINLKDDAVIAKYKQTRFPTAIDTYLLDEAEATAEANRRLNLWKVQRTVYEFEAIESLNTITVGTTITLKYFRFGLSAGALGLVIGVRINWKTQRPTITVLV